MAYKPPVTSFEEAEKSIRAYLSGANVDFEGEKFGAYFFKRGSQHFKVLPSGKVKSAKAGEVLDLSKAI